jgi:uncharacterized membrane protein YagU involved in acid resistance
MQRDVQAAMMGAIAGAIATIPMSAIMLGAQRLGYLGDSPPRLMSDVALGAAGKHDPEKRTEVALATELHLSIGVVNGAAFGVLSERADIALHQSLQGIVFGAFVWALAYRSWIPMLNIMPPIEKDRPDRQVAMFLAHVVYGATLGWVMKRIRR